jgi:hypothetical protein
MAALQDWEASLTRMSTPHLVQYATLTNRFVTEVRRRWATGEPVPARCTRQWIDRLAAQAAAAERLIAGRIDNLDPPA